jgi:hypothetical protein
MVCESWWAPEGFGCERKSGEECQILYKSMYMPIFQELGTALNLFSMEDSKNPIAIR